MDSFSSFKTDDSSTLNSMKLMSPIESCYRSPLRDTTNCVLPLEVGGSKKSDPVGAHQLPGEKREFAEENDFSQCQQSTPVKHLDCDTESDTTAEYESAGEASPWEKPSNVSALADYLAGVHLSTPDKIHTELNYFPFSPISAEDECDDEVTAIISNGSQSSSHTLSFHEREETSVSKQDKTVSHVANTSSSDVDPEEFKNSIPCKRHSETNVSSSFHSETLRFSDEAFGKGEDHFKTEMSCSMDENKLKTPPPSLNESEEITSSVVATIKKLSDSMNNEVTSSEMLSPKKYASLNITSSDSLIATNVTDHNISFTGDERKLVEQSPSAMRSTTNFSNSNKSPVPVFLEKDTMPLDSLEENNVVISQIESSSNVLQTSHINDYVTTTKHKIDTIFNSNKEIVSNVICETKQQIDNMFKRKSPIKELASNTVSHVIDSIKNLNVTESDSSPHKNVLIEKISSPISSAKQKIDSLFSPKKTILDKEICEKPSVSGVSVIKEPCGDELLKEENNDTNQSNGSFNTVTVEHLNLDTSASGLTVVPLTTASENYEVIETTKQQIDKIFKSLTPQKATSPNEVLELSNSTMSTDLEQDYDTCVPSPLACESGFEQHNAKQFSVTEFSVDKSMISSKDIISSAKQKVVIGQINMSSSEGEPESSFVLREDKIIALEDSNEISTISEVTLPVDLKPKVEDNISSDLLASNNLKDSVNDEKFNKTAIDEVSETTHQEYSTIVQGHDAITTCDIDDDHKVIGDSVSQNSINKIDEQHLSDYQSTFEVFKKDMLEASRTFHVMSPKKESFNISLSTILDQKEEVIFSENITEPLMKIPGNDVIISDSVFDSHCQKSTCTINSQPEVSSIAPNPDQSVVNMEHEESVVTDSQKSVDVNISPLELSVVIDNKIIGTYEGAPMLPPKSPEGVDLLVSPGSAESSDVVLKVNNVEELHKTVVEEVIDDQYISEDPGDCCDHDFHLKLQQEALDITAVVDEMTLRKEEVEDFVVVDVAELNKHVLVPVSSQLPISDAQDKKVLDISHMSGQFDAEKNLDAANGNIQHTASPLEGLQVENTGNQVQTEPASSLKELSAEVMITDVKKQINSEHIKKNNVEQNINISECGLVADAINIQGDVNRSSLAVSSEEVKNNASNIVSDGHQLNFNSREVVSPDVELGKKVELMNNITENDLTIDLVVEREVMDVSVPAEEKLGEVMNVRAPAEEKLGEVMDVSVPAEEKFGEVMDVSVPAEEKLGEVMDVRVPAEEKLGEVMDVRVHVEEKLGEVMVASVPAEEKLGEVMDVRVHVEEKLCEVMVVSVPAEEKLGEVKITEVDENLSVLNENNVFNKKPDDSIFIKKDKDGSEQQQSNQLNTHSSSICHVNIASEKKIVDSDINTLLSDEHINVNLNAILKSPIKEESFEKVHDFKFKQSQSESKQDQTCTEESICHISAGFEEEKCTISEIIGEKQIDHCSSKISDENEQLMVKPACSGWNNNSSVSTKDNAVVNESVVAYNNEAYKPSKGRSSPRLEVTNNLFSEIFQHGKDQMCRLTTKYSEAKQSKSEASITQKGDIEIIEQNCNTANFITKTTGIPSHDDSEFFKNAEFSSKQILSDKVKSPPFACPVSSDSIAFGSPSGYSLSLSPIDSFTEGMKCGPHKDSPDDTSTANSTSAVSCIKTYSSSAEIGMGSKSLPESLEIVKSDESKPNNELSPSLQTTLQIQGEMSTRNEKYSYNFNKSSKDFRGSPVNKNCEEVKYSVLSDKFKTFKLDDLSKSTIERKSYEDLLDRCLEQERLLGFDEAIKEEADKLIKEIANASSDDICVQPDEFPPANANNSEAGPVTADEDLNKADLFQDATLFDFDYLSKIGKGKPSRRLVRESLFLKFDPLAAAAAAVATPEPAQEMAQADSSSDVISTPPRAPLLHNGDDKLVSITPNNEAACSPASSTVATPPRSKARSTSCSATPTLRHDILSKEISKLQDLMMRQESSYQEQIAACTEEVEQLREQLSKLEARDNQVDLQGKLAETEAEAVKLRKELAEATESKKQLMMIMEEYEKTISQVVTMREDDKKKFEIEKEQISMEREGAMQHLRNMEIAFNDVHQKYEKCKEVIEAFKHNEEQYKISLNENRKTIIQQEENYQKLKEHAAQKLEQANIEISEMKKAHQAEIAKMVAVQRKMEIRVKSLEESLEQKKREAAELTKICDDLITKVEQ